MTFTIPNLPGSSQEWGLQGNVVAFPSPFSGASKLIKRPGSLWSCGISWPPYKRQSQAFGKRESGWNQLDSFLADSATGSAFYIPDFQAKDTRGSLGTSVLANGYFRNGIDGLDNWTVDAACDARAEGAGIRLDLTSGTSSQVHQDITLTANAYYCYVLDCFADTSVCRIKVQDVSGAPVNITNVTAVAGRNVAMFQASSASIRIVLTVEGVAADKRCYYSNLAVSLCGRVANASETGNQLDVYSLPTDGSTMAYAGDKFEVNRELKLLTRDLVPYGTAQTATAYFTPALRSSPTVNQPVIFHRPCAKFINPGFAYSRNDIPGGVSQFGANFTEFFT